MNKQTEHFLQVLQDIEQGKKVFDNIERIDAEREAWKRMFDLQSKLVMGLEMDKIKLEEENKKLFEELQQWKQSYRALWKRSMLGKKL